jgi:hypothetical protein
LYLLSRFAALEGEFVRAHRFTFYGAVAMGFLPPTAFLIAVIIFALGR